MNGDAHDNESTGRDADAHGKSAGSGRLPVDRAALADVLEPWVPAFVACGFYEDIDFVCVDCGARQVWTSAQQKWYYETAKGPVENQASRCRDCRRKLREARTEARRVQLDAVAAKHSMSSDAVDLQQVCDELRALGAGNRSHESRQKLVSALSSKWDGVCVAAAQTLCSWGDPPSIDAVRSALEAAASKPSRGSTVGALSAALGPHLRSFGLTWGIGLFLDRSHPDNHINCGYILDAFDSSEVLAHLRAAVGSRKNAQAESALREAIEHTERRMRRPG